MHDASHTSLRPGGTGLVYVGEKLMQSLWLSGFSSLRFGPDLILVWRQFRPVPDPPSSLQPPRSLWTERELHLLHTRSKPCIFVCIEDSSAAMHRRCKACVGNVNFACNSVALSLATPPGRKLGMHKPQELTLAG
jgi:hypothetical protein